MFFTLFTGEDKNFVCEGETWTIQRYFETIIGLCNEYSYISMEEFNANVKKIKYCLLVFSACGIEDHLEWPYRSSAEQLLSFTRAKVKAKQDVEEFKTKFINDGNMFESFPETFLEHEMVPKKVIEESLDYNKWFGSDVINLISSIILKESKKYFLSSLEFGTYVSKLDHKKTLGKLKQRVSTCDAIIGVVNINKNHWVAFNLDKLSCTLTYCDSFGNGPGEDEKRVLKYICDIFVPREKKIKWDISHLKIQTDDVSCGVFATWAVYVFAHNLHHLLNKKSYLLMKANKKQLTNARAWISSKIVNDWINEKRNASK